MVTPQATDGTVPCERGGSGPQRGEDRGRVPDATREDVHVDEAGGRTRGLGSSGRLD
jgi:hypothetical protein